MLVSLNFLVNFDQNSQEPLKLKSPLIDECIVHVTVHSLFWNRREAALLIIFVLLKYLKQVLEVRKSPRYDMDLVLWVILRQPRFSLNLVDYKLSLHERWKVSSLSFTVISRILFDRFRNRDAKLILVKISDSAVHVVAVVTALLYKLRQDLLLHQIWVDEVSLNQLRFFNGRMRLNHLMLIRVFVIHVVTQNTWFWDNTPRPLDFFEIKLIQ